MVDVETGLAKTVEYFRSSLRLERGEGRELRDLD